MSATHFDDRKKRIFIQKVEELPTLPAILTKIIEISGRPSASAVDLAQVISQDQTISSMVLRIVNSAFYGHFRTVSSISHAIVILGFQNVKSVSLGASIFGAGGATAKAGLDMNALWIHALAVATVAKKLVGRTKYSAEIDRETAFVAGLLHDLGKVIFDKYFGEEYQEVVNTARAEKEWIRVVERRLMEIDHAVAGAYLAKKWHFPDPVMESVQYHHNLEGIKEAPGVMPCLVHAADYCCNSIGLGASGNHKEPHLDPVALETLGITDETLTCLIGEVEDDRSSIEAFGID